MYKKIEREWAGRTLAIEIDKVAKQADGAVLVHYGETVVLVTAVANREPKEGADFFPLLANYVEMTYAAGRIPGGFFKREGRPTDREILSSRLIDRGIRPLFPKGFRNDTQVVATVLSSDRQNDPSILGIIGASIALEISDIPFAGPLAGVKVGRIDKAFIINPTTEELTRSDLDLIISGNREGVVMVEGGGSIVDEGVVLEAIFYGYEALKPILAEVGARTIADGVNLSDLGDHRPGIQATEPASTAWRSPAEISGARTVTGAPAPASFRALRVPTRPPPTTRQGSPETSMPSGR